MAAKQARLKEERKRVETMHRALEVREAKVAPRVAKGGQVKAATKASEQQRGELKREQEERKMEVGVWKTEKTEPEAVKKAAKSERKAGEEQKQTKAWKAIQEEKRAQGKH